jgi:hypothetical protein
MERFINELLNLQEDEEIKFIIINEINDEIAMGVKKINVFDSNMLVFGAYGGGYESIIWIDEFLDAEGIKAFLKEKYENIIV